MFSYVWSQGSKNSNYVKNIIKEEISVQTLQPKARDHFVHLGLGNAATARKRHKNVRDFNAFIFVPVRQKKCE